MSVGSVSGIALRLVASLARFATSGAPGPLAPTQVERDYARARSQGALNAQGILSTASQQELKPWRSRIGASGFNPLNTGRKEAAGSGGELA